MSAAKLMAVPNTWFEILLVKAPSRLSENMPIVVKIIAINNMLGLSFNGGLRNRGSA